MIATESNQLFTDGTTSIGFPLALLGMTDHSLHLVTAGQATVGISTLTSMHQALNTSLNTEFPSFLRIGGIGWVSTSTIKIKTKFLHVVRMTFLLITSNTKIKVITHSTVVSGLHRLGAVVTVVNKLVLTLQILKY